MRGISCIDVTRDLSVNAVVGGGVVTTDCVCRVVLSTSIVGIEFLVDTGTSMTRFVTGRSSGIARGPIGSLKVPVNIAVNNLIEGNRKVLISNGARVRPNSSMVMFYRGVGVGGVRGCFV